MSNTDAYAEMFSYRATALAYIIKRLVDCLEANGSLKPGQLQEAIQEAIAEPGAPREREDYLALAEFLALFGDQPSTH